MGMGVGSGAGGRGVGQVVRVIGCGLMAVKFFMRLWLQKFVPSIICPRFNAQIEYIYKNVIKTHISKFYNEICF